jgi:hypothetical protein
MIAAAVMAAAQPKVCPNAVASGSAKYARTVGVTGWRPLDPVPADANAVRVCCWRMTASSAMPIDPPMRWSPVRTPRARGTFARSSSA